MKNEKNSDNIVKQSDKKLKIKGNLNAVLKVSVPEKEKPSKKKK